MKNRSELPSPKITIPGVAGVTIAASINRMATHCGEISTLVQEKSIVLVPLTILLP